MANAIVNQPPVDLKSNFLTYHHLQGIHALEQRLQLAKKLTCAFVASDGLSSLSETHRYQLTTIIEQIDSGYQILITLLRFLSHQ